MGNSSSVKNMPSDTMSKKSTYNVLTLLQYMVIGSGIALLALNYYHAVSCPENNPDAIEGYTNAMGLRLSASESRIKSNAATLERLTKHLQTELVKLEPEVLKQIELSSKEEAVKIALAQDGLPVPAKPYYFDDMWGKSQKAEKLSTEWDDYVSEESSGKDNKETMDDDINEMENIDRQKNRFGGSFDTFRGDQGGGKYDDDRLRGFTDGVKQKKGGASGGGMHKKTDGIADDYFDAASGDTSGDSSKSGGEETWSAGEGGGAEGAGGGGGDEQPQALKDNLSDSDARHFCESWKQEHNVVVGVSWGSLPFDIQQKWLQYACDYLLRT